MIIDPDGVPCTVSPLERIQVSAIWIVVLIVINLRFTPSVCPAAVSVAFADTSKLPVPVVVIPLDIIMLPATIRLAFTVKVLVYPVQTKVSIAFVLAPTVHAAEAALNMTSSPAAGTPTGVQLPAVAHVPVPVQVLVAMP